jgi:hypothetical protein
MSYGRILQVLGRDPLLCGDWILIPICRLSAGGESTKECSAETVASAIRISSSVSGGIHGMQSIRIAHGFSLPGLFLETNV